jgi:hypothetical protein
MSDKKSRKKDDRARHWVIIIYPESAPKDWRDVLDNEHMPWVESPLHDKDLNADGEIKKAHYHVLLMFEGKKSFEQIKAFSDCLNAPIPQKVSSVKGMVRYMVHMDNPEKYQYDKSGIIGHGGADTAELLKPTSADRYVLIREMAEFVKDRNITEYNELFYYAMEKRFDDWFPLLCDSATYAINAVIKSNRHVKYTGEGQSTPNA